MDRINVTHYYYHLLNLSVSFNNCENAHGYFHALPKGNEVSYWVKRLFAFFSVFGIRLTKVAQVFAIIGPAASLTSTHSKASV